MQSATNRWRERARAKEGLSDLKGDGDECYQVQPCRCRWLWSDLSRGGARERPRAAVAARLSDFESHVSESDSEVRRSAQARRAGLAGLRAVRYALVWAVQVHLLQLGEGDDAFRRSAEAQSFRHVRVRLRLTYWPANGRRTPGARDGHHLAERQRLRRRTERGLESDPRVLEGAHA